MGTNEKNHGKGLVIKDGYPASFRNADGSMKNIYADDGSLTEEGKIVMAAREALSERRNDDEKADKERKRKRKIISWSVSAGIIVLFLLFFHVYISSDGGFGIYAKSVPTFSHTFINGHDVNDVLKRYNNASVFEQISIRNEPFAKLLFDKGIIYSEEGGNEQKEQKEEKRVLNIPIQSYSYYYYGEFIYTDEDWKAYKVTIIFDNKSITVQGHNPDYVSYFSIVGNPIEEYDEQGNHYTKYNVYSNEDPNKKIINIMRYENQTAIIYESESCNYEIFRK